MICKFSLILFLNLVISVQLYETNYKISHSQHKVHLQKGNFNHKFKLTTVEILSLKAANKYI